jgi:hypothetical protein
LPLRRDLGFFDVGVGVKGRCWCLWLIAAEGFYHSKARLPRLLKALTARRDNLKMNNRKNKPYEFIKTKNFNFYPLRSLLLFAQNTNRWLPLLAKSINRFSLPETLSSLAVCLLFCIFSLSH